MKKECVKEHCIYLSLIFSCQNFDWIVRLLRPGKVLACLLFIYFCYCGQSVMIQYSIGARGNEALITKYTKCHKQDDMSHLPRKWRKKSLDVEFYILTILKTFLIEIRLTARGGNGFF